MNPPDILVAMTPAIEAFEALGVPYHIGGSVASSLYGIGRSTADVDIVADLRPTHVQPIVERLKGAYYIQAEDVHEAIDRRSSFNVVHLETMLKLDIFVPPAEPFDLEVRRRMVRETLDDAPDSPEVNVPTPEDVVLQKLRWFKESDGVLNKQYIDALGVLKLQGDRLDSRYLRHWADRLTLTALLNQALRDAAE